MTTKNMREKGVKCIEPIRDLSEPITQYRGGGNNSKAAMTEPENKVMLQSDLVKRRTNGQNYQENRR
jgi:hypothetical protein